jgi:hypothetical protein
MTERVMKSAIRTSTSYRLHLTNDISPTWRSNLYLADIYLAMRTNGLLHADVIRGPLP